MGNWIEATIDVEAGQKVIEGKLNRPRRATVTFRCGDMVVRDDGAGNLHGACRPCGYLKAWHDPEIQPHTEKYPEGFEPGEFRFEPKVVFDEPKRWTVTYEEL